MNGRCRAGEGGESDVGVLGGRIGGGMRLGGDIWYKELRLQKYGGKVIG